MFAHKFVFRGTYKNTYFIHIIYYSHISLRKVDGIALLKVTRYF